MSNSLAPKAVSVLKEYKHIHYARLATINHSNINLPALNAQLDSIVHRVTLQYLLYVLWDLIALQELRLH